MWFGSSSSQGTEPRYRGPDTTRARPVVSLSRQSWHFTSIKYLIRTTLTVHISSWTYISVKELQKMTELPVGLDVVGVDRTARSSGCRARVSRSCRRFRLVCDWWSEPGERERAEFNRATDEVTAACSTGEMDVYLGHNDITVQTSIETLWISLHAHLKRNKPHVRRRSSSSSVSSSETPSSYVRAYYM